MEFINDQWQYDELSDAFKQWVWSQPYCFTYFGG